jgi:hypothetical protein
MELIDVQPRMNIVPRSAASGGPSARPAARLHPAPIALRISPRQDTAVRPSSIRDSELQLPGQTLLAQRSDWVEDHVELGKNCPAVAAQRVANRRGDHVLQVDVAPPAPDCVSQCDQQIFEQRARDVAPLAVDPGEMREPRAHRQLPEQEHAPLLMLAAWAGKLLRVRDLAYVMRRGVEQERLIVAVEERPALAHGAEDLHSHVMNQSEVRDQPRRGVQYAKHRGHAGRQWLWMEIVRMRLFGVRT